MRSNQYGVIFDILFLGGAIFFWVVRVNGRGRSMLLLLLMVLVVSLSCASRDGQAVLARFAASCIRGGSSGGVFLRGVKRISV